MRKAFTLTVIVCVLLSSFSHRAQAQSQTPYNSTGTPWSVPGTIQAEDFDNGGEGVAYHDVDAGNNGGGYRSTDVDTWCNGVDCGIGWIGAGEWLEYSVNVATSGSYTVEASVGAPADGGSFHIEVDGVNKTGTVQVPNTGDWRRWATVTKADVVLAAGQHVVRVVMDTNNAWGAVCDFNSFRFIQGTPSGSGTGLKGEYYDNIDLTNLKVTRIDPGVNFNWGEGAPDPSIAPDSFSARWTGQIEPRHSETYTFYLTTDNGRRLWINNQLIIDKWIDDWDITYAGTIALAAGQKYEIKVEYFENWGGANAKLEWASLSQAREIVPQSQLYYPSTQKSFGEWSPVAYWGFVPIHMNVLPNGKVLAWTRRDGEYPDPVANGYQVFVWDPATNSFTTLPNPKTDVFCTGHSFLPDGRLLATGGHVEPYKGLPDTNIFDFATNSWTAVAPMNAARWYPTNCTLGNGEVLVISGDMSGNGDRNRTPQVWKLTGGWRNLTTAATSPSEPLYLYPWTHLAPNGKIFVSGPDQITRYLDTAGTGAWSTVANSNFGYRSEYAGSSVMYDVGKVMIVGGGDPPTATAEVIDLNAAAPAWRYVGWMAYARRHFYATLLPDGKVIVTGGTSSPGWDNPAGAVKAAELWDPATEKWSTMASMQTTRTYHSSAVLLPDGRVLTGGGGLPGTHYPNAEIYAPPYLFNADGSLAIRPTITNAPGSVGYNTQFFVQTPDAANVTKVTWVRLSTATHSFNQDQRINHLSFSKASGGLNVTTPSNGNLCPPGYYMLFIFNGNGVPSIAKFIKIN